MAIRAKDIADMLNVSPSAVSIVLNNRSGVSDATRALILGKVKELHCEYLLKADTTLPSATAAVSEAGGTIGFVIYKRSGELINEAPFFNYSIESITEALQNFNYSMKFIYLNRSMGKAEILRQLNNSGCDGFIFYAVEMLNEDLDMVTECNYPFVMLDNSFMERDVDSVAINNVQGIHKAVQYAYEMGHRKIGYIQSNAVCISFNERFREYGRQLAILGIRFNADYVIHCDYSEFGVSKAVSDYVRDHSEDMPTIFISDNDYLGAHAMQAFKTHGYKIPSDISIIGLDNRNICAMVNPPMTTINVPLDLFGPSAVDYVLSKIRTGRTQSMKLDVGINLIKRSSVAKLN